MPPSLFETPPRRRPALQRLGIAYSWVFAVVSLLGLALMLVMRWDSIDNGNCCVFGWSTPGGEHHAGWLLDFQGTSGYWLAAGEFVVIALALIASRLHAPALRHAGLLTLLAWSALWFAGAARQLVGTGEWWSVALTLALALAVIATHVRTRARWTPEPRAESAPPRTLPETRTA